VKHSKVNFEIFFLNRDFLSYFSRHVRVIHEDLIVPLKPLKRYFPVSILCLVGYFYFESLSFLDVLWVCFSEQWALFFLLFYFLCKFLEFIVRIELGVLLVSAAFFKNLAEFDQLSVIELKFWFVRNEESINEPLVKNDDLLDLAGCSVQIFCPFLFKIWFVSLNVLLNDFSHFVEFILFALVLQRGLCQDDVVRSYLIKKFVHYIKKVIWVVSQVQISQVVDAGRLKLADVLVHQPAIVDKSNCLVKLQESA